MIVLKEFISLYAYRKGHTFNFSALDPVQVRDFYTTAHFRVSKGDIPTLGGDLVPGLTTKEALLNKPIRSFCLNEDIGYYGAIDVYI